MSLTDTINSTNVQKENVKMVATNIDNKLVELGGEQATDLADVPNKMQGMVGQYNKIAILDINESLPYLNKTKTYTFNVEFNPQIAIMILTRNMEDNIDNSTETSIIQCSKLKEWPNKLHLYHPPSSQEINLKLVKLTNTQLTLENIYCNPIELRKLLLIG